jgi:predicted DNA-binding ribbon-helix-helix protein
MMDKNDVTILQVRGIDRAVKRKLKAYAAQHEMTMAKLLAQLAETLPDGEMK